MICAAICATRYSSCLLERTTDTIQYSTNHLAVVTYASTRPYMLQGSSTITTSAVAKNYKKCQLRFSNSFTKSEKQRRHFEEMQSASEQPPQTLEGVAIPPEMFITIIIRQYFTSLRQEKGHKPDASPIDLEILLVVKLIAVSDGNVIDLLQRVGIILVHDKIVINGSVLTETLQSSRSRINNTLNRLKWEVVPMGNNEKYEMLAPLLERSDVRNWTIRRIPPETALYHYIATNPEVLFKGGIELDTLDVTGTL